jgi:hypothetical protein
MSGSEDHPIVPAIPFPRRALTARHRGPQWLAGYEAQHPGTIARLYQVYGGAGPIAVDQAVWKVLAPIAHREGVTLTVTTLKNYRTNRLGLKTPRRYRPVAPELTSPQEPSPPTALLQEAPPHAPAPCVAPPPVPEPELCRHCGQAMSRVALEAAQVSRVLAHLAQEAHSMDRETT